MFGHGNDTGSLCKSVGFLLNASAKIYVQVVELYGDKVFDCADLDKVDITSAVDKAKKVTIKTVDRFSSLVDNALKLRVQKSTNQNKTSSRSHAIFKISMEGSSRALLFADLAGFESIEGKENQQETVSINSSSLELNKVLIKISKNEKPICTTALTRYFKPHVNENVIMLFHLRQDSVETMKRGFGYIKELSNAIAMTTDTAKSNVIQKPSATSTPFPKHRRLWKSLVPSLSTQCRRLGAYDARLFEIDQYNAFE